MRDAMRSAEKHLEESWKLQFDNYKRLFDGIDQNEIGALKTSIRKANRLAALALKELEAAERRR